MIGLIDLSPVRISEQIELSTKNASSNTTQLYNVSTNAYSLSYQVKVYGYQ
ncbi:MAG: hypothetical protein ACFFB5_01925 [Promethearchaeota archaeon]